MGRHSVERDVRRDIPRGIPEQARLTVLLQKETGRALPDTRKNTAIVFVTAVFLRVIPYAALSGFSSLRCLVFQPYTSAT